MVGTESQLDDCGVNFIRTQFATVQGASVPLPHGGKQRQIMVRVIRKFVQAFTSEPFLEQPNDHLASSTTAQIDASQ